MAKQDLGIAPATDDDLLDMRTTRGYLATSKLSEYTRTPGVTPVTADLLDNIMYGTLVVPARNCTVDTLHINVITAGTGGGAIRLGIYTITFAADGTMSAALLVDAGTVTQTPIAVKTATIGSPVALLYGTPYMFVVVSQGTSTINPQISFVDNVHLGLSYATSATALSVTTSHGWQVASTTGALPSTPTFVTAVSSLPIMAYHCSV